MDVQIVEFPKTKVAILKHFGPPALEHESVRQLVAWKLENRLLDPLKHRSYGVHYTNPLTTPPAEHHVDFCLSIQETIAANRFGIVEGLIPACRCATARDIGSRFNNQAAPYLWREWLPQSGQSTGNFPMFFHYVNVGPNVEPEEMMTDVYLPLSMAPHS